MKNLKEMYRLPVVLMPYPRTPCKWFLQGEFHVIRIHFPSQQLSGNKPNINIFNNVIQMNKMLLTHLPTAKHLVFVES